ncbi:MTOR-associated protein MEAK7 [Suricata suricatta]|uniref:MTOR-associated protein MEAK7 n=1 Tax=Suricata suricatta TaxID=37032 RepID=UPI001155C5A7|nr:MTOR-associated protein MEAK7 [Suricata suricatta]
MGNSRSQSGPGPRSHFLPEEQAEIDRLFEALSSEKPRPSTCPRSFSLEALKSHIGEALPLEMVTRLYDGMRRLDLPGKAKAPSEGVSQEQLSVFMSHLLKGSSEEKSLVIVNMISATEGPVKAREVQKFTEDLVGSVAHVLSYRQELRGWAQKRGPGPPPSVQVLAAQLFSEMGLQVSGDDTCFLFSISPRMAVYTSTGYNDHYMYLNHGQQTIPNGLGMGGQHNYFGLWIDVDFGKGHSKAKPRCTTYNSPQLSAQEDFRFEKLEVWAVGDAPGPQQAKSTKSVLDVDPEAQALLEISGHTRHSQGLREPPEDE